MSLTTTVRDPGRRYEVVPSEASGHDGEHAPAAGSALDLLVRQVLDCPDEVLDVVIAEAVRGLEALAGASLGGTATDARVVLQRRFGRALGRSGWSTGQA